MLNISKKANQNYLAKVIRIDNLVPIQGANKIQKTFIHGDQCIISKTVQLNDLCIYFSLESTLSKSYLSWSNSYQNSTLNRDTTVKGFFCNKGRVKPLKLMKGTQTSVGYIVPVSSLQEWLEHEKGTKLSIDWEKLVNTEFDYYDDIFICKKYTSIQERNEKQKLESTKKDKKIVKESKLVENQFKLHSDTPQLGKNIHTVFPEDIISITAKLHGTSGVFSKLLIKTQLKWYEKLLVKFGINLVQTAYGNLYSSRKVLKNAYFDGAKNKQIADRGYYKQDIWGVVNEDLKEYLEEGMTLYGEIVGYLPGSNSMIQKNYDYSCEEGKYKFYIYRITTTTPNGSVVEWDMNSIQQWAKEKGLLAVPLYYYGPASQLFKDLDNSPNNEEELSEWQNQFLQKMKDTYLEGNDTLCVNKVYNEGIVLRREGIILDSMKCKSWNFLNMESVQLDSGIVSIEDEQSMLEDDTE